MAGLVPAIHVVRSLAAKSNGLRRLVRRLVDGRDKPVDDGMWDDGQLRCYALCINNACRLVREALADVADAACQHVGAGAVLHLGAQDRLCGLHGGGGGG